MAKLKEAIGKGIKNKIPWWREDKDSADNKMRNFGRFRLSAGSAGYVNK